MKGEPSSPKCKFSRALMEIFEQVGYVLIHYNLCHICLTFWLLLRIKFEHFDILTDEKVRQGLKEYSKWPTYPQVYVKGELIGGIDIIKELQESGELKSTLNVWLSSIAPIYALLQLFHTVVAASLCRWLAKWKNWPSVTALERIDWLN